MTAEEANLIVAEFMEFEVEELFDGTGHLVVCPWEGGKYTNYFCNLDKLVHAWKEIGIEFFQGFPEGYPETRFKVMMHVSQDETKSWSGKHKRLGHAACIATAKCIKYLQEKK